MATVTIGEAKNNLSALIAELSRGEAQEHIVKNRNTPVARIVPFQTQVDTSMRLGAARGALELDDDAFDSLDVEIAEMFGTL